MSSETTNQCNRIRIQFKQIKIKHYFDFSQKWLVLHGFIPIKSDSIVIQVSICLLSSSFCKTICFKYSKLNNYMLFLRLAHKIASFARNNSNIIPKSSIVQIQSIPNSNQLTSIHRNWNINVIKHICNSNTSFWLPCNHAYLFILS